MYNFKSLGQHISIKLGMEVEADMRNQKMVINKEKCILGGIMAVALLSVGIGLASVLSDSKSNSYNKENVIDLNEGIAGNTDDSEGQEDERDAGEDGQESLVSLGNEAGNAGGSGTAGNSGGRNTGSELYGEDDRTGMTGNAGTAGGSGLAGDEGEGTEDSEEMPVAAGVAIDPL